jgi:HEAT repeat protein
MERHLRIRHRSWIAILASLILTGCAAAPKNANSQGQKEDKLGPALDLPLPPLPPAAPKETQVALDPELRSGALAELTTDCNASDPFLRSNAIESLANVAPQNATDPVLKGLSDPHPAVRFSAAMAAGTLNLRLAYQPLLAMVSDSDLRVRAAVRFALHRIGDARFTHDLERYATDPDPKVRACTAQMLGLLGERSAIKILLTMLHDVQPAVRIQAAESLWRLGDDRGEYDLVGFTISAYPDDQIIAIQALAEPRDRSVLGHIEGLLVNDYAEVSLAAARAAGMLGSDEGWTIAIKGAHSADARQRIMAAMALGAIGRSDLQPRLAELMKDDSAQVRLAAATAILQLRAGPKET